jgi:putative transposase
MPRRPRVSTGGYAYHVLNRAAGRRAIFRTDDDYEAFEQVLARVHERLPVRVLGYCLMPNHWHLILWPRADGQLSEFMRLVTVTHTQRWHAHYRSAGTGPLYQGRFKSFPIQADDHLLSAWRYVERNALAARMVKRSEAWPRCSAHKRLLKSPPEWLLAPKDWPVELPRQWLRWLNAADDAEQEAQTERIELSVTRGRPLGEDAWVMRTAVKLSLESTLRPRGRPPKGP